MSIDCLPAELYSAIISHVPPVSLPQTVLSLTRAIPRSPIPLYHLFHSVSILHPGQAFRLHKRISAGLSKKHEFDTILDVSSWIHELSIETWQVDADIVVNLVHLIPNLESLKLWIGPTNFEPNHLEELFSNHIPTLRHLSLRFRPYVQKATYLPFLKAAYFDDMLLALSKWPPSPQGLHTLSIVQDPDTMQTKRFAQLIVFFRLDLNLSLLIHSPAASVSLKSLRIRIPARPIVQPLTTAYLNPNAQMGVTANETILPPIEFLDLSTSSVSESDVEALLIRFKGLKHLVLDGCTSLLRGGPAMGQELSWWSALGRRCALAGLKKARDREKRLQRWLETQSQIHNQALHESENSNAQAQGQAEPRRARPGRRGLATATFSLRGASVIPQSALSIPSSVGMANAHARASVTLPKVHIVPPQPTLLSISMHPMSETSTSPKTCALILAEFEKGWHDGIRVIWERRARMGATFLRGPGIGAKPRFLKFKNDMVEYSNDSGEGFEGLEDVEANDESMFFRSDDGGRPTSSLPSAPILCLSGSEGTGLHPEGCGHSVSRYMGGEIMMF